MITPPSTPSLDGSFQFTKGASGLIGIIDMFGFENSEVWHGPITVNKARNVLGMVNIIATKLSAYCPQLALPSCIRLIILWITNFEPLGVSPTCPSFCYRSNPPPLFFLFPSPTLSGRIFLMISLSAVLYKKSLPFTICWNLFLSILGLIDFCFMSFSCNRWINWNSSV